MGKRIMAFTLVELTVVITIIVILSTFVAINLTSAQKKARDDKRVSDAHILANALDQYATTNQRKYPCPTLTDGKCVDGNLDYSEQEITKTSQIYSDLQAYINPVPTESRADFKYIYAYRNDGLKAFVIVKKSEAGAGICNIGATSLPVEVTALSLVRSNSCYFVER